MLSFGISMCAGVKLQMNVLKFKKQASEYKTRKCIKEQVNVYCILLYTRSNSTHLSRQVRVMVCHHGTVPHALCNEYT